MRNIRNASIPPTKIRQTTKKNPRRMPKRNTTLRRMQTKNKPTNERNDRKNTLQTRRK